ncbi:MAG: malonyl-ACP O-methyltransferase BioC [Methylococcaceae bacterium]
MQTLNRGLPDKQWVGRSFGQAAERYDGLAGLQRCVADTLLNELFLRMAGLEPLTLVDVGAGTGYPTRRLREHWRESRMVVLDLAEGMLQVARRHLAEYQNVRYVCGDAEHLPLADGSADLIFTSLALQWCSHVPTALLEFHRVLKPGGRLAFSTFGPATLHELSSAWATVDGYTHVSHFPPEDQFHHTLDSVHWTEYTLNSDILNLKYPDVLALMRELKGLGARNMTHDRPRHLQGKSAWQRMVNAYPASQDAEAISATFEIISGHSRKA